MHHLGCISIHSPRKGRDVKVWENVCSLMISIHSPRKGRDIEAAVEAADHTYISIHSPRKGRDRKIRFLLEVSSDFNPLSPQRERPAFDYYLKAGDTFQSTLPAKGETTFKREILADIIFQSTLPAKGETIIFSRKPQHNPHFNPLSPQRERPKDACRSTRIQDFNPLSPQRE